MKLAFLPVLLIAKVPVMLMLELGAEGVNLIFFTEEN